MSGVASAIDRAWRYIFSHRHLGFQGKEQLAGDFELVGDLKLLGKV